MCIALYYINSTGIFHFVLLFNREEFSDRPTEKFKVIVLDQDNEIVGGQDQLQSGTWLAFNLKNGMIAFLTNRNQINHASFTQKLSQIVNMIRFQYPKMMSYLYPKLKSRGQLILDLVNHNQMDSTHNFNYEMEDQHLKCNYTSINNEQIDNVQSRILQAYLHKQNYMGFNLFVGNIFTANYYIFSSLTNKFNKINQSGTICSFSTVGQFTIVKEDIAKKKFTEHIENSKTTDELFEKLFGLAQEQFFSTESFFKAFPEESNFFIPEYINKLGRKRGTRTTTILIFDGNQLQIKEKTYI